MADFRTAILPLVDAIRGIPGQMGLRLFTPAILVRTWSGSRAGVGIPTDSALLGLRVGAGLYPIKARVLTTKEIVSSGDLYKDEDIELGPITPPYTGSTMDNDAISAFSPIQGSMPTEVFFKLTGPGLPVTGAWYKKITQRVDRSFRYMLVVRRTAEIP